MSRKLREQTLLFATISAIGKAAVVGASLGLALFGAMDFAFAVAALDWLEAAREEYLIDYFAVTGGVLDALFQVFFRT